MKKIYMIVAAMVLIALAISGCATSNEISKGLVPLDRRVTHLEGYTKGINDRLVATEDALAKKAEKADLEKVSTETAGKLEALSGKVGSNSQRLDAHTSALIAHGEAVKRLRAEINSGRLVERVAGVEDKVANAHPKAYAFWAGSFETKKSEVSKEMGKQLDTLTEAVKKEGLSLTRIIGFADPRGKVVDNKKLSLERAEAVKAYLAKKGLDMSSVIATGAGETNRCGGYSKCRRAAIFGERQP